MLCRTESRCFTQYFHGSSRALLALRLLMDETAWPKWSYNCAKAIHVPGTIRESYCHSTRLAAFELSSHALQTRVASSAVSHRVSMLHSATKALEAQITDLQVI